MMQTEGWLSTGLACLLGATLAACASTERTADSPASAESEERVAETPMTAPSHELEMSMEMETDDEDEGPARQEYIPPPTQTYSPAVKLKEGETEPKP